MYLLYFLVSLMASIIGAICGVGGGIIIKPVLDATGTFSVSSVSFLSGCTVMTMSVISVLKSKNSEDSVDANSATPLAIGAVIGGLLGKWTFEFLKTVFRNETHLGGLQAALLIIITIGTLLYSIYSKKIHTLHVKSRIVSVLIGLILGILSSFLGIGGGPINLIVLFFFFSMSTKKAAANSLYIIMFSQMSSLLQTLLSDTVPSVSFVILSLVIGAGVLGGIIGGHINKKISAHVVDKLFIGLMIVIVLINIYNLINFTILI
ncbi:sulfite exporter TauE/SafE family protein [Clostridium beijerinckii]|uniref:sulfite exporter TauE/SafE family protein n=1 Tax=Clostridium beijerinckii TaxID=1520 RepID=UPI0012B1764E|nr:MULTISPECIES: sulfite exporter TauE/SafE family protein [Bacteria]MRY42834.1 TSUP family transporter [Parabacteroides distasonis]MZK52091.1 TSUP family transporter [Clostridium beijerinckii]MZK60232.1 TSUP family transporter [Clostridium beijerinckii]MZK70517.1 TSUP family transporter [Clostridium beijerinckii]MZK75820.1 TSUP family transporter [Clostridium beijerinckii]